MVSQTFKYALKILGYLVREQGVRSRGEDIARSTGIPANYLSKILNQLRKQGIVEAEKGWGGGFKLKPEVLQRPIRDILVIFDGIESTKREDCIFGLAKCDKSHPCPLHHYWERICAIYVEMLTNMKVRDLGDS